MHDKYRVSSSVLAAQRVLILLGIPWPVLHQASHPITKRFWSDPDHAQYWWCYPNLHLMLLSPLSCLCRPSPLRFFFKWATPYQYRVTELLLSLAVILRTRIFRWPLWSPSKVSSRVHHSSRHQFCASFRIAQPHLWRTLENHCFNVMTFASAMFVFSGSIEEPPPFLMSKIFSFMASRSSVVHFWAQKNKFLASLFLLFPITTLATTTPLIFIFETLSSSTFHRPFRSPSEAFLGLLHFSRQWRTCVHLQYPACWWLLLANLPVLSSPSHFCICTSWSEISTWQNGTLDALFSRLTSP